MERWAARYKDRANFLCVGCAGGRMAVAMGTESKLKNCANAYIEHDDCMPSWGQLGCNGFIVFSSGDQQVLNPKTAPFNQVRGLAFKHVEALIDALAAGKPVPKVCPGQLVKLHGLKSNEELNGKMAMCVAQREEQSGRCAVQLLDAARVLKIRPENLSVQQETEDLSDEDEPRQPSTEEAGCGNCESEGAAGCDTRGGGSCAEHPGFGDQEVRRLAEIESIGVAVIDQEHQECAAALSRLASERSSEALQCVLEALREHFAHEEGLLDAWVYKSAPNKTGFNADASARKTHFADHARMLRGIAQQLATGDQVVPSSVVNVILRDFEEHADRYDGGFGERMSQAMSRVAA
eukprot:TRINITY_DN10356_c0_g1_i1.p1 TRINITY_DN10356_c0_g1~~TRINITY_DN10356_c0_g1_i1.p1  ORF type:complete len:350 (-),score=96.99 TRINITY_DN10356_c0_g1_i1:191-1240(-)